MAKHPPPMRDSNADDLPFVPEQTWHRRRLPAGFCAIGMVLLGLHLVPVILVFGANIRMDYPLMQFNIWGMLAFGMFAVSCMFLRSYEEPRALVNSLSDTVITAASMGYGVFYLFKGESEFIDEPNFLAVAVAIPPVVGMVFLALSRLLLLSRSFALENGPPALPARTGKSLLKVVWACLLVLAPIYGVVIAVLSFFEGMKNFAP